MTNVMLDGGKEIDLLAIDPYSLDKYHIEVRVATGQGFRIRSIDTQTSSGRKHKVGLDTLNEIKFSPSAVVNFCSNLYGGDKYKRVLVVWEVKELAVIEQAKKIYGIEIWRMPDIMKELMTSIGTKGYRDDILRSVQLLSFST